MPAWLVAILLAATTGGAGYLLGRADQRTAQASQGTEVVQKALEQTTAGHHAATDLAAENSAERGKRETVTRTLIRYVDRYEKDTPAADRCPLPGTWRLRHDAAADGRLPISAGPGPLADGTDATAQAPADPALPTAFAAPIDDAAAIGIVADNYTICHEAADKLAGWQRRQRRLKELQQSQEAQP